MTTPSPALQGHLRVAAAATVVFGSQGCFAAGAGLQCRECGIGCGSRVSNCNGQYSPQRGLHQNYSPSVVPPCVGPSSANLVLSKLAGLTAAALRLGRLSNRSGTCDTQQQAQAEAYSPAVVGIAVALVEAGLAHAGPGGGPADVVAARVGGGAAVGAVRVLAAGLAGKLARRDLAVPQACEAR